MGKFTLIEYEGGDAGEVLIGILNGMMLSSGEKEEHEVESDTDVPFKTGFQPAELDEGDDDEDEGRDSARG